MSEEASVRISKESLDAMEKSASRYDDAPKSVVLRLVKEARRLSSDLKAATAEIDALRADLGEVTARADAAEAEVDVLRRDYDAAAAQLGEATTEQIANAGERDTERARLVTIVNATLRERAAREAWLASLPDGSCANPPTQELLDAEKATGEALLSITGGQWR